MTFSHSHDMPFGAQLLPDGRVRFRLWAPARDAVAVWLEEGATALAMTPQGDGWFELVTDRAKPGMRYRYRFTDGTAVADPASRCQAGDVHEPSVIVDAAAYRWRAVGWHGRPWEETVLYELHTGLFGERGGFSNVQRRLFELAALGVTAVELMPVADFAGSRGWGYDGVLPFAPDRSYGSPDDLKALIDAAHGLGLMIFLDVVYNHFGPEGNYLHQYAPGFFTRRFTTPWGEAIDFSRQPVRDFFIHNALYWIEEFQVDGLRLDAVHAIRDDSETHILTELADRIRGAVGPARHVHLVLENDANQARFLGGGTEGVRSRWYTGQWNDDIHHAYHVLLTGEDTGYYADYADRPMHRLARGLAEGFIYQGDVSAYRDGEVRGEPSAQLPPTAFVNFVQNHDQIGNRAFGERLAVLAKPEACRAAQAVLLLAPHIPMLFMGEEYGETRPFLFFCDFHDELAAAVRRGRRDEFARFPAFSDPAARERIPDPNLESTYEASRLDRSAENAETLAHTKALLAIRHRAIVPRLAGMTGGTATVLLAEGTSLAMQWRLADGSVLHVRANLGDEPASGLPPMPDGEPLYETGPGIAADGAAGRLPPWSVVWALEPNPKGAA